MKQINKKKVKQPFCSENNKTIDLNPSCPIYFQVLSYTHLLYHEVLGRAMHFQSVTELEALFLQLSNIPIGRNIPIDAVECLGRKVLDSVSREITREFSAFCWIAREGLRKVIALLGQSCSLKNCWIRYVWGQISFDKVIASLQD